MRWLDSFIEKLPNGDFMKVMVYSTQAAKSASAVAILKKNLEKKGYKAYSQSMFQMSNNYYFAVGKKTDKSTFKIIIDKAEQEVNETVKDFIENFRCYKVDLNEMFEKKDIHRVEIHKDYKKIYTFEKLENLKELNVDFEDRFLGFVGKY